MKKNTRIAIITGASAGLGTEFVRQLEGYFDVDEVWMIARREEPMRKLAGELKRAKGVTIGLDLQDPESLKVLEKRLKDSEVTVRVLINNAGYGKIGSFAALELEPQLGEIDLNCRTLTALTHICLPFMTAGAHLIPVASSIGYAPAPNMAVYAATKAYVLSFSYALRHELKGRGIHVTAVCPGPVNTEFVQVAVGAGKGWQLSKNMAATADGVVAKALRDAKVGRAVSVYGPHIRLFTLLAKILPFPLVTLLVGSRKMA